MRQIAIFSIALILLLMANTASFSNENIQKEEPVIMAGMGTLSCADYVKQYQVSPTETERLAVEWTLAYLSATNEQKFKTTHEARDLNSLSPHDMIRFVNLFCSNHPSKLFKEGVDELYPLLLKTHQLKSDQNFPLH